MTGTPKITGANAGGSHRCQCELAGPPASLSPVVLPARQRSRARSGLKSALLLALAALVQVLSASAQSYSIDWFTIDGGGGTSIGGAFSLSGTIGQPDASPPLTGGPFSLTGGFWPGALSQTSRSPAITRVVAEGGAQGDLVEIFGSGFGDNPDDLLVYIQGGNGIRTLLPVVSATDTHIIASVGLVRPDAQPGPIVVERGEGGDFPRVILGAIDAEFRRVSVAGERFALDSTPQTPTHPTPDVDTVCYFSESTNGVVCVEIDGTWPKNVKLVLEFGFGPGAEFPSPSGVFSTALVGWIILPGSGTATALECAQALCAVVEGDIYSGIGELHCSVSQVGPDRYKLTISADDPIHGVFNICYTRPSIFAGVPMQQEGLRANIEQEGGRIRVSNLGTIGHDGIAVQLGESQGWQWDMRFPDPVPAGAQVVLQARGKVAGQISPLHRTTLGFSGNDMAITPDLSSIGASRYTRKLYFGGALVHEQSGLTGVAALVRDATSPLQSWHHVRPVGCAYRFDGPRTMSLSPGVDLLADTVELIFENPQVIPECVSSLAILGANLPEFTLERASLLMFPQGQARAEPHRALGQAQFEARDGRLIIANLGSSGIDGVSIDFDEVGKTFSLPRVLGYQVEMEPLSLPTGGEVMVEAWAVDDELPHEKQVRLLQGHTKLRNPDGTLEIFADFNSIGSPRVTVQVHDSGELVGAAEVDGGGRIATLTTFTNAGGLQHKLTGFGKAPPLPFCFLLHFDHNGTFTLEDGSQFVGDEIRLLASAASGGTAGLSTLVVQSHGIESMTLVGETVLPIELSVRRVGGLVELAWTGAGILEVADDPAGPWTVVMPAPASNPYLAPALAWSEFFRVRH